MDPRISFLTDYGTADGFVAACHGAIARIAPAARVLDITHEVPPGDVRRGAALLAQTLPYLPPGVHVAVVDPGVGTARLPVLVCAGGHMLVGPDNGLLMWAADALGGATAAYRLTEARLMADRVSATFHGRDIFAPVAAHLAAGTPPEQTGDPLPLAGLVRLPDPVAYVSEGTGYGEVLTVDRFGNVQTSLGPGHVEELGFRPGDLLEIAVDDRRCTGIFGRTFADADAGQPVVLVDSADLLAVAVNGGNAAEVLGVGPGTPIAVSPGR
ncbi:SAM hydrolase/SAM-dependent halogenase family protein [Yinghuangia soli]|uniref:SAM-dependent chlorinase/fluorinase n=1 Tax=Yinghuangia soli TaxID=2908204 RepID=A0AA41Q0S2_9ACTN|nr:SAM-dependent chlorinase/fluorinase [Yinghuangia soli]MCF2529383.1 SAM-dependent chlorinase/fluorinase [Yinghuangia soli]